MPNIPPVIQQHSSWCFCYTSSSPYVWKEKGMEWKYGREESGGIVYLRNWNIWAQNSLKKLSALPVHPVHFQNEGGGRRTRLENYLTDQSRKLEVVDCLILQKATAVMSWPNTELVSNCSVPYSIASGAEGMEMNLLVSFLKAYRKSNAWQLSSKYGFSVFCGVSKQVHFWTPI